MKPNKAIYNNEKISKIITLSSDYQKHRELVQHAKPVIDFSDQKHMKKVLKLSIEKDKYTHNVRNLRLTELHKENQQIMRRMRGVNSSFRQSLDHSLSPKEANKTMAHNLSRQSLTSASSQKSCSSNIRRRTMKMKQIQQENKKIAERILHPKMKKDMNFDKLVKFYEKEQSYSRIRSRFSDRSQTIMQNLALDGLKLQKKYVQFLPQLSFKKLQKPKPALTARPKRYNQKQLDKSASSNKKTLI